MIGQVKSRGQDVNKEIQPKSVSIQKNTKQDIQCILVNTFQILDLFDF